VNAAAGIAAQVQGCIMGFAGNLVTAVRPQLVKQYACKEYDEMFVLLQNGIKMSFLLLSIFSIPLICETHFVLHIWLGLVPDFAVDFCIYTLLFNFFANISILLVSVIHATGNIKRPSFINGTLYLLVIPFSYVAYRIGCPPGIAFLFNVLAVILGMFSNAWTIKLYIQEFLFNKFFLQNFLKCISILVIVLSIVYSLHWVMEEGWLRLVISVMLSSFLLALSGLYILFGVSFRKQVFILIKNKLCRKV
jgi:Na+-driven multidrug efflux pump